MICTPKVKHFWGAYQSAVIFLSFFYDVIFEFLKEL